MIVCVWKQKWLTWLPKENKKSHCKKRKWKKPAFVFGTVITKTVSGFICFHVAKMTRDFVQHRPFRTRAIHGWWTTFIQAKLNTRVWNFRLFHGCGDQVAWRCLKLRLKVWVQVQGQWAVYFSHLLVKSRNQMGTSLPQLRYWEREKMATLVTLMKVLFSNVQKLWMCWHQMQQVALSTLRSAKKGGSLHKANAKIRGGRREGMTLFGYKEWKKWNGKELKQRKNKLPHWSS